MFLVKSNNFLKNSNIYLKNTKCLFSSNCSAKYGEQKNRQSTPIKLKNADNEVSANASHLENYLEKSKLKIFELMSVYEEAIGIKEIKEAQQSVLDAERRFMEAQKERRDLNIQLLDIQSKLKNLRDEMDRLSRTDTRFLHLFTEEHNILKSEVSLMKEFKSKENEERELFFYLSAALRDSQEKERVRVERTKYLQFGLSIACTVLGVVSTLLYSYLRNSKIQEILNYEKQEFKTTKYVINEILEKQVELQKIIDHKFDEFSQLNEKHMNELKSQNEQKVKEIEISKETVKNEQITKSEVVEETKSESNPVLILEPVLDEVVEDKAALVEESPAEFFVDETKLEENKQLDTVQNETQTRETNINIKETISNKIQENSANLAIAFSVFLGGILIYAFNK